MYILILEQFTILLTFGVFGMFHNNKKIRDIFLYFIWECCPLQCIGTTNMLIFPDARSQVDDFFPACYTLKKGFFLMTWGQLVMKRLPPFFSWHHLIVFFLRIIKQTYHCAHFFHQSWFSKRRSRKLIDRHLKALYFWGNTVCLAAQQMDTQNSLKMWWTIANCL